MEFFLVWLLFAGVTAAVASGKGRSGFGWFLLGCIFGIFALIVVAILPNLKHEMRDNATAAAIAAMAVANAGGGDEKTCPACAERIKAAAIKCRFCGHEFEVASA